MKLHVPINKDGELLTTPNQKAHLAKSAGKDALIEIDERTTDEKQRFIEGSIVPYFYYQHLKGVYKDFKDARSGLKWATNHTTFELDQTGKQKEVTRSMSEIYASNKRAQDFIDRCESYFMENGYEFPDSSHFNDWKDRSPLKDEVYPPLQRLVEKYKEMEAKEFPWRK